MQGKLNSIIFNGLWHFMRIVRFISSDHKIPPALSGSDSRTLTRLSTPIRIHRVVFIIVFYSFFRYLSHEVYQKSTFPPYCLGGGYLMSSDVLASVIKLSYGRLLFPMEDLYVGLMIRELDGVQPRDERKHFNLVYNGKTENDCDLNSIFLLHRVVGAENLGKLIKQARYALENC